MTVKKVISKLYILLCVAFLFVFSITSYAETGDRYQIDEKGNFFPLGGINEFDGIKAQSREETRAMEANLIANNYLLCTTDNKMINNAHYKLLVSSDKPFWFSQYLSNEDSYYWTLFRVYIFKPSFDDMMEQMEEGSIASYTHEEISASTVVINYSVWDDIERAGTISNEYNNNIPEWYATGYMEVHSPVDCEVTFWYSEADRYYVLYITKNKPFKIKLRQGCYHLVEINSLKVNNNIGNAGEDTLPYNNQIQIRQQHTEDCPYLIELYDLCDKYDISDVDISGKPDLSIDQNQDIPTESVEIDEESSVSQEDTKSNSFSWTKLIPWIVLVVAIMGVIIYEITEMKRKDNDDDDSEDD